MEKIPIEERDVLSELENLTGISIPLVKQIWEVIDGENIDTFGYVIRNNHITELSIKYLLDHVPDRNFEPKIEKLPNSIGNLTFLEKIDISHNNITEFPISFYNLQYLQEIYMGDNKFRTLPKRLCFLPQLRKLCLNNPQFSNPFDSIDIEEMKYYNSQWMILTDSIKNIKTLKILDLTGINVAVTSSDILQVLDSNGCEIESLRKIYQIQNSQNLDKIEKIKLIMGKTGLNLRETEIIYEIESTVGPLNFNDLGFIYAFEHDHILIEYKGAYITKISIPYINENEKLNEVIKLIIRKCKNRKNDKFLQEGPLRYYNYPQLYHELKNRLWIKSEKISTSSTKIRFDGYYQSFKKFSFDDDFMEPFYRFFEDYVYISDDSYARMVGNINMAENFRKKNKYSIIGDTLKVFNSENNTEKTGKIFENFIVLDDVQYNFYPLNVLMIEEEILAFSMSCEMCGGPVDVVCRSCTAFLCNDCIQKGDLCYPCSEDD